jgi:hypothetical protein
MVEMNQQINTLLANNTTQLITPTALRSVLNDFVDSLRPGYGGINLLSLSFNVPVSPPGTLTPFNTIVVATAGVYAASAANGQVTRQITTAGLQGATDFVICNGAVAGPNNDVINVELFKNGVATGYRATATCQGVSQPVDFGFSGISYTAASAGDALYELRVNGAAGAHTFSNVILLIQTQPVNAY